MPSPSHAYSRAPIWLLTQRRRLSAEALLQQFNYYHPPVPIRKLVRRLEIELYEADELDGLSGACERDGYSARIWLNGTEPEFRKRFTLAHEMAHVLLHLTEDGVAFRDVDPMTVNGLPESRKLMERQANGYAAKVLMPATMLKAWIPRLGGDHELLATKFGVSNLAMRYRLDSFYRHGS